MIKKSKNNKNIFKKKKKKRSKHWVGSSWISTRQLVHSDCVCLKILKPLASREDWISPFEEAAVSVIPIAGAKTREFTRNFTKSQLLLPPLRGIQGLTFSPPYNFFFFQILLCIKILSEEPTAYVHGDVKSSKWPKYPLFFFFFPEILCSLGII